LVAKKRLNGKREMERSGKQEPEKAQFTSKGKEQKKELR